MISVDESHHLPDVNRLSILMAMILLAYALAPFVNLPERTFSLQFPHFFFQLHIDYTTIISLFTATLAAAGMEWLLQDHPHLKKETSMTHWALPALTAWAIGIPLSSIAASIQWWVVFALGGLLLTSVFVAEYIVVDPDDTRQALASAGLTSISYALLLVVAIALRASGLRLYLFLPPLVLAVGLISLRSLYLHISEKWSYSWGLGITLVIAQLAIGLYYWPLSPLKYGLIILAATYGLVSLAGTFEEGDRRPKIWIEPAIISGIILAIAVFFEK